MRLSSDATLPISAHREELLAALRAHPVIVVCGATGSGKSTQLPKLCLEAGRGGAGLIGHTQPRRIAAVALAARIAAELGTRVGDLVGYQVRFTDRTSPACRLKLMTDGILLKELEADRELRRYDTLIIDEAHERSLNIDLLLGVLKSLTVRRPELRIVITSATLDPNKFAAFFGGAPVIEVSGRSFPVEIRYRPLVPEPESEPDEGPAGSELTLPEAVLEAVRELAPAAGDILVFLPGERQIHEVSEMLGRARLPDVRVLPLLARLSLREQQRVFEPHRERRIVLATNVAETSLTVPGIRHVIDSGLARIGRYSVRAKVQRLPIEPISRASAAQRAGRCGREAPGVCIRLYSQEDFERREPFTAPEVLRTNLASVILRLAAAGLGDPESFPFLDPPDSRLINDGVRLLQELEALDDRRRITALGRQIATLPVDPRLGRMLLAAARKRCLRDMLVIAAFLEIQDPRERPLEASHRALDKHMLFAAPRSDFMSVLKLWRSFQEQSAALGRSALLRWCRAHFLSFVRLREWQDLNAQLTRSVRELGLRPTAEATRYAELHQALLSGFLSSVGRLDEHHEYHGPRGLRFVLAPGSALAARSPSWIVAGSLIETTRVYARMVAAVQPAWIEAAAAHLIRRECSEPEWLSGPGFVAAYESASLHGLTLRARRRVNFGRIAPRDAREIFIREALVAPRADPTATFPKGVPAFLLENRRRREEIEVLEAKIRRRDILVSETRQIELYSERIPEHANSVASFMRWLTEAERAEPQLLELTAVQLMARAAPEAGPEHFPDALARGETRLPLEYRFDPAAPDDGITVRVPEPLLDSLHPEELAWLVPGMRLEKITAVLRGLPKARRKQLVPVPEHARTALSEVAGQAAAGGKLPGFFEWLASWISRQVGERVTASDLAAQPLPLHLRFNLRIVDAEDRVIAEGRDLGALRARLHRAGGARRALPLHRSWDFGELPERREVERNRIRMVVYPALEPLDSGVVLTEAHSAAAAERLSRAGMARLAMLALPQQAKHLMRWLQDSRDLVLLSGGLKLTRPMPELLTWRSFREAMFPEAEPLPRTREQFERRLAVRQERLAGLAGTLASLMLQILKGYREARRKREGLRAGSHPAARADVSEQLESLLSPDFIESTPGEWLDRIPTFLTALERRLARLVDNAARDAVLAARVRPFVQAWQELRTHPAPNTADAELQRLKWMIEEFRVSLFAQELGTSLRVSEKRLEEQLARARAERGA